MNEIRRSFLWVWLIVAVICGAAAGAPFLTPAAKLQGVFPSCEARLRNRPCVACGLTTGFIAISNGEWKEAQRANAAAIPLFAGFAMNFAAAVAYTFRKYKSGGKTCKS